MANLHLRTASQADFELLCDIEKDADRLFASVFPTEGWGSIAMGYERASLPGFILVASAEPDSQAVGFVHVMSVLGGGYLDQLSVRPSVARRGIGRELVHAAIRAAADRNMARLTLRTFVEVPWNAPFYESCGFRPSEPDSEFLADLLVIEAAHGLTALGRRVQMQIDL